MYHYASLGWPGIKDVCAVGLCFCEADSGGLICQPSNFWSNLGFVSVGLWVAGQQGWRRSRNQLHNQNLMTKGGFFPFFFAMLTLFVGLGSMYFHAGMTWWSGICDLLSMFLFVNFIIAYNLKRMYTWSNLSFLFFYIGLTVILMLPLLIQPLSGKYAFMGLAVLAMTTEGLMQSPRRWARWSKVSYLTFDRTWFALGVISILIAHTIWWLSRTGGPLCFPHSILQGHALWHLLASVAVIAIFRHYHSERTIVRSEE